MAFRYVGLVPGSAEQPWRGAGAGGKQWTPCVHTTRGIFGKIWLSRKS